MMTLDVKQQDAANIVWAAEAAEVGVTGSRGAQRPEYRRLAKPKCRGEKKSQIRQMKWCPEAMSRAREAQCR
ncbi:hypothetical protein FocTR4_00011980 [Fusarium oxysporum f. sp. cubense]|uniref:Uncharacterized protein n=1 Tax=Fusarium oxysporum f. sp. cubense TaxID=61366 RepID=A0A5C6SGE5_FUSOC|nr:hypothetical protein FocTR4_00011980 [Fusarium oxysporum f. sp. cubense]